MCLNKMFTISSSKISVSIFQSFEAERMEACIIVIINHIISADPELSFAWVKSSSCYSVHSLSFSLRSFTLLGNGKRNPAGSKHTFLPLKEPDLLSNLPTHTYTHSSNNTETLGPEEIESGNINKKTVLLHVFRNDPDGFRSLPHLQVCLCLAHTWYTWIISPFESEFLPHTGTMIWARSLCPPSD